MYDDVPPESNGKKNRQTPRDLCRKSLATRRADQHCCYSGGKGQKFL